MKPVLFVNLAPFPPVIKKSTTKIELKLHLLLHYQESRSQSENKKKNTKIIVIIIIHKPHFLVVFF